MKSNFVYPRINRSPLVWHDFFLFQLVKKVYTYKHLHSITSTSQRRKHADMLCVLVARYPTHGKATSEIPRQRNRKRVPARIPAMHCLVIQPCSRRPLLAPVSPAMVRVPLGVFPGDPTPLLPPPPAPVAQTVLLVSPSPPAVLLSATRMPARLSVASKDDARTISSALGTKDFTFAFLD